MVTSFVYLKFLFLFSFSSGQPFHMVHRKDFTQLPLPEWTETDLPDGLLGTGVGMKCNRSQASDSLPWNTGKDTPGFQQYVSWICWCSSSLCLTESQCWGQDAWGKKKNGMGSQMPEFVSHTQNNATIFYPSISNFFGLRIFPLCF